MLELLIIRADQMVEHADLYVTDNWQQLLGRPGPGQEGL